MLQKYADICTGNFSLFSLYGDSFFDEIDGWIEDFDLGAEAPRDERVIEEILLRLLVMSLFVLMLWKLFVKSNDNLNIPNWIYIYAIILAATLFAAGHIPFTAQSIGLSTPILIRGFILNGVGGLGFGYLYWRKGLSYSMLAHGTTHVFMQAIFMPILF